MTAQTGRRQQGTVAVLDFSGGIEGYLMSLVCGVYLRRPSAAFPVGWEDHWRENLDRSKTGSIEEFRDGRLLMFKLDIGAFDAPGWQVGGRYVTALSGDAILGTDPIVRGRADDIAAVQNADVASLHPLLIKGRGYFNLAHYDRRDHRFTLAVDRVGVRSLYIYQNDDLFLFAGALRLIETLPGIRLTTDLQGVLESASFGVPLDMRTRYTGVTCMLGGSQLLLDGAAVTVNRYWKFDRDACNEVRQDLDTALDELYGEFQKAVRLRVGRRKAMFSALSGGLDSRSITTELWRLGLRVHTLNVSWKGSQDEVLGAEYAAKLGLDHHHVERPLQEVGSSLAGRLQLLMSQTAPLCEDLPSTPLQLWSGNGGSLGLGHTKMSAEVTSRLAIGDLGGAAHLFLKSFRFNLSGKLLREEIAGWAENLPYESLMTELERTRCKEPARALYIFRLEQDQRRLLAFHFEQIDLVPFEFIEPLFDPEILSIVCTMPMAFCLGHHMYHELLKKFPPEILSVPWQTYPGHEPCPVPHTVKGFDQWRPLRRNRRGSAMLPSLQAAASYLYRYKQFQPLLRTDRVLAAYAMRGLELRNTSHLLKQVELLGKALAASEGRVDIPYGIPTRQ